MAGGVLLGLIVLATLHEVRGVSYWNHSEGVYALSSRLLLEGSSLYEHTVGAQPPGLFLAGAALLAVHDELGWLRLAMGATQLVGGAFGGIVVARLTGSRLATAATPPLSLLTPWALHEHGSLTPELFAPPVLLGAIILAARPGRGFAGGGLAAGAVLFKVPYLVPAAAVVGLAASRRRAALGAGAALAMGAGVSFVVFGTGVVEDAVLAQMQTGRRELGLVIRVWAQAGWNLLPFLVPAVALVPLRGNVHDRRLLMLAGGLAAAMLATLATNIKVGTGLNILVPIEAVLLPLTLSGIVVTGRAVRTQEVKSDRRVAVMYGAVLLLLAQSASVLLDPRGERPFLYPTSTPGSWGRQLSSEAVKEQVARAESCPPALAYSGPPYVAFLAHRRMPHDQPDQFLIEHSERLAEARAGIQADARRCP